MKRHLFSFVCAFLSTLSFAGSDAVRVGAIRWDAWYADPTYAPEVTRTLSEPRFNARLPFFAEKLAEGSFRIDGRAAMAKEIDYAADAGLDYFAFLTYPAGKGLEKGLELFLAAPNRHRMHFALILHFNMTEAEWPVHLPRWVSLLEDSGYLKTGSRPVVFVYGNAQKAFPSAWLEAFRAAAVAKGLTPYFVSASGGERMSGTDAVSAYAHVMRRRSTYAELVAENNRTKWFEPLARGEEIVPHVTAGWDKEPRQVNPVFWEKNLYYHSQKGFAAAPTAAELAAHLSDALAFVRAHPMACPSKCVLVYAWNEFDEGGWLCPTWTANGPDTSRLNAIRPLLRGASAAAPLHLWLDEPPDETWETIGQYPRIPDAKESVIFRADEAKGGYNHHAKIAFFGGRFYAAWSNSHYDEDAAGQRVLMATSPDGLDWSEATEAIPSLSAEGPWGQSGYFLQAGEFVESKGRLFVVGSVTEIVRWENHARTESSAVYLKGRFDWPVYKSYGRVAREIRSDGTLGEVFSLLREPLDPSKLLYRVRERNEVAADFLEPKAEWNLADAFAKGKGRRFCEPTVWKTPDGRWVALLRDDSLSRRKWVSLSHDGQTWTAPEITDIHDAPSQDCQLTLPDGRILLFGNHRAKGKLKDGLWHTRDPLTVLLSEDGLHFSGCHTVKEGFHRLRVKGPRARGGGAQYPRVILKDGNVHVVYSDGKEDIATTVFPLAAFLKSAENPEKKELFNGRDLSGWYTYLKGRGRGNDPKGVFSVRDGMIHVTGEEFGALVTEEEYGDYQLTVEYRFLGGEQFGEKRGYAPDSGILLHSTGPDGGFYGVWMESLEVNLIKGATGDFWGVGAKGSDRIGLSACVGPRRLGPYAVFNPQGDGLYRIVGNDRVCNLNIAADWRDTNTVATASNERPIGSWNTVQVVCCGGAIDVYFNGCFVNHGFDARPTRGRIQLQSEGCAIEFRRVTLDSL